MSFQCIFNSFFSSSNSNVDENSKEGLPNGETSFDPVCLFRVGSPQSEKKKLLLLCFTNLILGALASDDGYVDIRQISGLYILAKLVRRSFNHFDLNKVKHHNSCFDRAL